MKKKLWKKWYESWKKGLANRRKRMAKATLIIMAAGIGSRFGGGIKQLEPVGPNGEIIMDYSIMMPWKQGLIRLYLLSARI